MALFVEKHAHSHSNMVMDGLEAYLHEKNYFCLTHPWQPTARNRLSSKLIHALRPLERGFAECIKHASQHHRALCS